MLYMFTHFFSSIIKVILLLSVLSSCSYTTTIYSDPKGAKVFVNNIYVGDTPYIHTFTNKEAKNQTIKLVTKSPPAKKLSTIEKIKMFEKMSKEGKISKKKYDKFRTQMEGKKSPWIQEEIPKGLRVPNLKENN